MLLNLLRSTTLITLVTTCVNALAGILMALMLGPELRGALGAIITWSPIFATLFLCGLHDSVSLIAGQNTGPPNKNPQVVDIVKWGVLLGALGILAHWACLPWLISEEQKGFRSLYVIYSLHVGLFLIYNIFSHLMMAHQDTLRFNISRTFHGVVHLVLVYLILSFSDQPVKHLVIEHLLVLVCTLSYFFFHYPLPWDLLLKPLQFKNLKSGWNLHFSFVLGALSLLLDRALAVYFLSNESIGYYHVSHTFAFNVASVIGVTFQYLLLPQASRVEDIKERSQFIITRTQFSLLLLLISVAFIWPFISWILLSLFGKPYAATIPISKVLLPAYALVYAKVIASRAIKALHLFKLGNLVELSFLLSLLGFSSFLWSKGQLTALAIAWACLLSATFSYLVFLVGFQLKTKVALRAFFDIKDPMNDFIKKVKGLIHA